MAGLFFNIAVIFSSLVLSENTGLVYYVPTWADVDNATYAGVGSRIITRGFASDNDGGQAEYLVDNSGATADGYAVISLGGSKRAVIQAKEANVRYFGATGNGSTNDRQAFIRAIAYAGTNNLPFVVPEEGTFKIDTGILVQNQQKLNIVGRGGTIWYNTGRTNLSALQILPSGLPYGNKLFMFRNCGDVLIDGLKLRGDYDSVFYSAHAFYGYGVRYIEIKNVQTKWCPFYSTVAQETDTVHSFIHHNRIEKWWGSAINPGRNSIIENNWFIQGHPDSTIYDRVSSSIGSSHAIYAFAGHSNMSISNNYIENGRIDGVKISGTSYSNKRTNIVGNIIKNTGTAITIGNDDTQITEGINIIGNQMIDCYGRRLGYTSTEAGIRLYGCRNINIENNVITYSGTVVFLNQVIRIQKQSSVDASIFNIKIINNTIGGDDGVTLGSSKGITAVDVSSEKVGYFIIEGNTFNGLSIAFDITNCAYTVVRGNTLSGMATFGNFTGVAFLDFSENQISAQSSTYSSSANHISLSKCAFPNIQNNRAIGWDGNRHLSLRIAYGGDGTLLLTQGSGLIVQSGGKETVIIGYGDGWSTNDSVIVNSSLATYGTDFSTRLGLRNWIDGLASISANFLADGTSTDSNYIVINHDTIGANSNKLLIATETRYRNAGIYAANSDSGNGKRMLGRGGSTITDKGLVFSPRVFYNEMPSIVGRNSTASNFLQAENYYISPSQMDNNAVMEVHFTDTIPAGSVMWFKL